MRRKPLAQVSLEYLQTYAIGLVIIAIIAGVLFALVQPPTEELRVRLTSTQFLLKNHSETSSDFTVTLQNNTGTIVSVAGISAPENVSIDSYPSGDERFQNGESFEVSGTFENYDDYAGFEVQYGSQGYTKTTKIEFHGSLPKDSVVSLCGNGTCEAGDGVCPADAVSCPDKKCSIPACNDGACSLQQLGLGDEDPGSCYSNSGCSPMGGGYNCRCSGSGTKCCEDYGESTDCWSY